MLLHQQFPEVERLLSKKETTTEETCEWPLNHSDRGNHWVVAFILNPENVGISVQQV